MKKYNDGAIRPKGSTVLVIILKMYIIYLFKGNHRW